MLTSPLPLTPAHVALAADGRLFSPCRVGPDDAQPQRHADDHREIRELELLRRAAGDADPGFRRQAVQAYGRLKASVGWIAPFLTDPDPTVRSAAAQALSLTLRPAVPEPATRHPEVALVQSQTSEAGDAYRALMQRVDPGMAAAEGTTLEEDEHVVAAILEALGGLPHAPGTELGALETLLVDHVVTEGRPYQLLGAVRGLEVFVRLNRGGPVAETTRQRLREIVGIPEFEVPRDERETFTEARRTAMLTLTTARDTDVETILAATRGNDTQTHRLAVSRMNPAMPEFAEPLRVALSHPSMSIRTEAVRVFGRALAAGGDCSPLEQRLDDPEPIVAMTAMDLFSAACESRERWLPRLVAYAQQLAGSPLPTAHKPARALAALARVAPDEARRLLDEAISHPAWEIRITGVEVAQALGDEPTVRSLVDDREPNVRTAVLSALRRLESPAFVDAALAGLTADDFDLIRTAAAVLEAAPAGRREDAATALVSTLMRLTRGRSDTSRDPRVAMLNRLGSLLDPAESSSLLPYLADFDPRVADAATVAYSVLSGVSTAASVARPSFRYPYQPPAEALASLPATATIRMDDDQVIELELLTDVAPVSVARFAELVEAGYYDGLTFHRFAPLFVIQGGSPGANEYSGVARYWRDEIGASNLRGTVGLSTRGRDTADGQIFINLVDNIRLDGDYTVFARVTDGMDVVDRILPGARISAIALR